MRQCVKCGLVKDESLFFSRKKYADGLDKKCKECTLGKPLTRINKVIVNGCKCCTSCKQTLPVSEFSLMRRAKNGYAPACKQCMSAKAKEKRRLLREEKLKNIAQIPVPTHKKCSDCNTVKPISEFPTVNKTKVRKACKKCSNKAHNLKRRIKNLRINFNMSIEEYELKIMQQNNKCKICGSFEQEGVALAVDHNHTTGEVRVLLCRTCNLMLGFAKDNTDILKQGIKYLRQYARTGIK